MLAPRSIFLACLALCLGCAATDEERWRTFNEDGVALFAKGNYREALDSFDYAATLHAQDPVIAYNIAQCHDRLDDVKNAEQYYAACLQRDPKHGDARLALVHLRYRTGRVSEGNQMIRDWLIQDPKSADAHVAEDAWRLRQERNYPLAQGKLLEALSLEPTNRRALTELAILDELQGMPDRAYVQYERILAREPNQIEIRERLELLKTKGVRRPAPN
jgi:tetratricopeptide (TPR) repeat protein